MQLDTPSEGDVLVSQRSHGSDYEVSIVPGPSQFKTERYDLAVERAIAFARSGSVNAWFTADHAHFKRLTAVASEA